MLNIFASAVILAAYLSFGRKIYYAIGLNKKAGLIYPASFALSLGFAGTFMAIAGFLKLYNLFTAYTLIILMCLVSYREIKEIFMETKEAVISFKIHGPLNLIIIAAAIVWGIWIFLTALTPPTYYDSLTYHLGCASQYIASGGIKDLPGNIFSYFPQIISMNYLLCLLLSGAECAKVFQFYIAVMAIILVCGITAHYKGRPLISAILLITSPLFVLNSTRAGAELPVMFFSMLMLLFVLEKNEEPYNLPDNIFLGLIMGMAISSKYTAFIVYVFFMIYLIYMFVKKKQTLSGLIAAGMIPFLVLGPYLIKNILYTGNPVYPFFSGLFSGSPKLVEQAAAYVSHVSGFGSGMNIAGFLKSPWVLTVNPAIFGGDAAAGLILVVFFLILCGAAKRMKTAVLFIVFYYTAWYFTGPVLRFLLPIEAACAVIGAVIYSRAKTKIRVIAFGMLVFLQALTSIYFVQKYLDPFSMLIQPEGRYISNRVSYYKAASFLNNYDKNSRLVLLLGEARVFYFNMPVISYTVFNRADILENIKFGSDLNFIKEFMECKAGFLMVNRTELKRLKNSGFGEAYEVYGSLNFKNIMDKFFKKLYIDNDCEIYEYKG